jgi:hypothetical protein
MKPQEPVAAEERAAMKPQEPVAEERASR